MIFVLESNKEISQVKIALLVGGQEIELGNRKHNLIIYQLAKKRARDITQGINELEQGYLYKDWLYEQLIDNTDEQTALDDKNIDFTTINQHFSRFKKLVNQKLECNDDVELIEHRTLEEETQVRFIPTELTIIESAKVIYDTRQSNDETINSNSITHQSISGPSLGFWARLMLLVNAQRKSIHYLLLMALITTSMFSVNYLVDLNNESNSSTISVSRSLVFLEPTFTASSAVELERQYKLREQLHSAITDYVDQNPNILFKQIVNDRTITVAEIGEHFNVDDIVSAEVDCDSVNKCSFSFKQHSKEVGWQVKNSFNLPLSLKQLDKAYWGVQFQIDTFYRALSHSKFAPPQGVDSHSFELFVALFSQWKKNQVEFADIQRFNALIDTFPNWHFAIKTYQNVLQSLYLQSKEPRVLHELEVSVAQNMEVLNDPIHKVLVDIFFDRIQNRYTAALAKVNKLAHYGASNASARYQYGLIYSEQQQWLKVKELYQFIEPIDLNSEEFELVKTAYWRLADFEQLENLVNDYLLLYPDCLSALIAEVNLALAKGNVTTALTSVDKVNKHYPTHVDSKLARAHVLTLLGKLKQAQQVLLTSIESYPRNINVIYGLGRVQLFMGEPEKANSTFSKLLTLNGNTLLERKPMTMAFAYAATGQMRLAKKIINNQENDIRGNNPKALFKHQKIAEFYAFFEPSYKSIKHAKIATELGLDKSHFQHQAFNQVCQQLSEKDNNEQTIFCRELMQGKILKS